MAKPIARFSAAFVYNFDYTCAFEYGSVSESAGDCQLDLADIEYALNLSTNEFGYGNLIVFGEPKPLSLDVALKENAIWVDICGVVFFGQPYKHDMGWKKWNIWRSRNY